MKPLSSLYSFHMDCHLPDCDITFSNKIMFPQEKGTEATAGLCKFSKEKRTEATVDVDHYINLQHETAVLCFLKICATQHQGIVGKS